MNYETQPSSNLGLDEAIDPGPAIGPAEIVLLFVVLAIGMACCFGVSTIFHKIFGKTPGRSDR